MQSMLDDAHLAPEAEWKCDGRLDGRGVVEGDYAVSVVVSARRRPLERRWKCCGSARRRGCRSVGLQ